jgi:hypothetical protein
VLIKEEKVYYQSIITLEDRIPYVINFNFFSVFFPQIACLGAYWLGKLFELCLNGFHVGQIVRTYYPGM